MQRKTISIMLYKTNEHPTALWRNLKSLVSNISTHKPLPSSMIFNEKQVNNKQNIVDSLNKHFVNISSYSDVNSVDDSQFLPLKTYVDSKLYPSAQFVVNEITPFEVMQIVKSIKNTKSVSMKYRLVYKSWQLMCFQFL